MKKLFAIFYLTVAFLFAFSIGAVEQAPGFCSVLFEDTVVTEEASTSLKQKETKVSLKANKNSSPKQLVDFVLYAFSQSHSKARLSQEWKTQVLNSLPEFKSHEVLNLFHKLSAFHDKLDLNYEKKFFRELEEGSVTHLADFNKNELLNLLWIFINLDLKSPSDSFIQAWRESAYNKRREFNSKDRYGARAFFKKLEVPTQSL